MKETLNCNGELVTINGHNLHVQRAGNPDAPAIVFMAGHCTVSPIYDFKVLYEKLLQDFRVIVIENSAKMLSAWADQAEKLKNGEISKDQYDHWRYTFPAEDTTQIWAKVPSQALSDMLVDAFKEDIK